MIAKCPCDHCGGNIEFATEEFLSGSGVTCPHCGKETQLSVTQVVSRQAKPAPKVEKPVQKASVTMQNSLDTPALTKCPSCRADVSTMADFCPKCGHRFKYAGGINLQDPVHVIGLGICFLIIISVIYYIFSVFQ